MLNIIRGLDYLWPEDCVLCQTCLARRSHFMGPPLCAGCQKEILNIAEEFCQTELCGNCQLPLQQKSCNFCSGRVVYFDRLFLYLPYADLFRSLVLAWKYEHRTTVGLYLASLLAKQTKRVPSIENSQNQCVTVVPSASPNSDRLYKPAKLVAKELGMNFVPLLKKRSGSMQHLQNRKERDLTVTTLFKPTGQLLKGSFDSAFLIDDILTTGASMNEAARILKQNGIKKVFAMAIFYRPLFETILSN